MKKTLFTLLIIVSMNCFCNEENKPLLIGENFKKIIKKREVSQTEKEKKYYISQYNKFKNSLIKELYNQIKLQNYGINKDTNPSDQNTVIFANNLFIANAYEINLAMLNGEYTQDSVNKVIRFWKNKGVYNPQNWINVCKKRGKKILVSNKKQIEREKNNRMNKGIKLKEYFYWDCTFIKGKSELIYDF